MIKSVQVTRKWEEWRKDNSISSFNLTWLTVFIPFWFHTTNILYFNWSGKCQFFLWTYPIDPTTLNTNSRNASVWLSTFMDSMSSSKQQHLSILFAIYITLINTTITMNNSSNLQCTRNNQHHNWTTYLHRSTRLNMYETHQWRPLYGYCIWRWRLYSQKSRLDINTSMELNPTPQ